jgi:hypothetical protein
VPESAPLAQLMAGAASARGKAPPKRKDTDDDWGTDSDDD